MKITNNFRVENLIKAKNVIAEVSRLDNGELMLELSFKVYNDVDSKRIALFFKSISEMRALADYIISLAEQVEEIDNEETER